VMFTIRMQSPTIACVILAVLGEGCHRRFEPSGFEAPFYLSGSNSKGGRRRAIRIEHLEGNRVWFGDKRRRTHGQGIDLRRAHLPEAYPRFAGEFRQ